ncbi:extracellular solute-binding protein [Patescibacteria group bacterium]|nr:extracellular solute-binding protein [Patescibacteria group bacterium]
MKLRPFEIFLVSAFAILAVGAVTLLALYNPPADPDSVSVTGSVSIWGTLPDEPMARMLRELAESVPAFRQVQYTYVPIEEFNERFVTALADRTNPDLLLIPHEEIVPQRARLLPYSYESFSLRDYKDRYIDGAEVFALEDGIYAIPIAIDPLVLFWNRNLLGNAGFLGAPTSWEQLTSVMVSALTVRKFDRTIERSALAMGESQNITHIYPVLLMLAIQAGSRLVTSYAGEYRVEIDATNGTGLPLTEALRFYMSISDPGSTLYSWNRAQPLDRDAFIRETLAMYFGFASEGPDLAFRNPNLNFDIAEVPKGEKVELRRTYGRTYGLAVVRNAPNLKGAYAALNVMSEPNTAAKFAQAFSMAPATRAGLAAGTSDVYASIAYRAAPIARSLLAPGHAATTRVFSDMVTRAGTDRLNIDGVANTSIGRLRLEY